MLRSVDSPSNSALENSASNLPLPMRTKCRATFGSKGPLRVEAIHGFVEHDRLRVTEQNAR